jgi:hypothetical protein
MKLYTVVILYLQMCMKEYGCCPKFGRRDNLTYTLEIRSVWRDGLVSATRPKWLIGFKCNFTQL